MLVACLGGRQHWRLHVPRRVIGFAQRTAAGLEQQPNHRFIVGSNGPVQTGPATSVHRIEEIRERKGPRRGSGLGQLQYQTHMG